MLNKDMTLCISLSARPSNNGTRFHNHLYEALDLNWIYKAFAPTDLTQAIAGVRGLGIRGCAISMPYKEDVIELVDRMDPSAEAIDSVNTIVNDDGVLTAHNTDYAAIAQLITENDLDPASSVLLRGSGGMAKATAAAFRNAGFTDVTIVARNETAARSAWPGVRRPTPSPSRNRPSTPPKSCSTSSRCPPRRRSSPPAGPRVRR
jgi:shikimate dehydrogenase